MAKGFCNSMGYAKKDAVKFIKMKMYAEGVSQEQMAREIGITQQGFSYKLQNQTLTLADLLVINKTLHLTDEEILRIFR